MDGSARVSLRMSITVGRLIDGTVFDSSHKRGKPMTFTPQVPSHLPLLLFIIPTATNTES